MTAILRIVLLDLLISCDNISVIALITHNLPPRKQMLASRFGLGMSLVMKILFTSLVSVLFGISWLHIRLIGGIMLIYVVYTMLRDSHTQPAVPKEEQAGDRFLVAMVSILAADISMSLDNVLALAGIVSGNGALGSKEILLIIIGLLISFPILLLGSQVISGIMQRFKLLIYLCAGYLMYTAVLMIFEDPLIELFFESIQFTLNTPVAILLGVLVVTSSVYTGSSSSEQKQKRTGIFLVFSAALFYALFVVGVISYLETGPVKQGITLSVELVYHFKACGANAVFALEQFPEFIALCLCFVVGFIMSDCQNERITKACYLKKLQESLFVMLLLVLLLVVVLTIGLSFLFGFGNINLPSILRFLLLHLLLYSSYITIFCMICTFVRLKSALIVIGMIVVHAEMEIVEFLTYIDKWPLFSSYLPGHYLHQIPITAGSVDKLLILRIALCAMICMILSTWIGLRQCEKK